MKKIRQGMRPLLAVLGALFALSFPAIRLALDIATRVPTSAVTLDSVRVATGIALAIVACMMLIGGRFSGLSFALYLFALSRAAQPAGEWTTVLPHAWSFLGGLCGAVVAGSSIYGYVALCVRMPSDEVSARWRSVNRVLPFYAVLVALVYAASIGPMPWPDVSWLNAYRPYAVFGALIWIGYAIGLIAYLDRRRTVSPAELVRTRWVAVAIVAHVAIEATFFALGLTGRGLLAQCFFILNPAPYAFAYALVRGRIVDVRVFGGRALVYAALSAVPITVFTVLDVLFARELESTRLASVVIVTTAVLFSFWLQSLHRKIDRFVERVFFKSRHQAHATLEHMILALPFVERLDTLQTMLVRDVPEHLGLLCAAAYLCDENGLTLRASAGCHALPSILHPDDPLALYARSSRSLVSLRDVPASRIPLPADEAAPAFALPVVGGNRIYAILLYGEHRSGDPMDAEEARLLVRLAQAAANAYEHLLLLERDREIDRLRSRLALQTGLPGIAAD
jgi:GAF domain